MGALKAYDEVIDFIAATNPDKVLAFHPSEAMPPLRRDSCMAGSPRGLRRPICKRQRDCWRNSGDRNDEVLKSETILIRHTMATVRCITIGLILTLILGLLATPLPSEAQQAAAVVG